MTLGVSLTLPPQLQFWNSVTVVLVLRTAHTGLIGLVLECRFPWPPYLVLNLRTRVELCSTTSYSLVAGSAVQTSFWKLPCVRRGRRFARLTRVRAVSMLLTLFGVMGTGRPLQILPFRLTL